MEPNRQEMALGSAWLIISTDEELDALIDDLMENFDDERDDDESLDETWDAEEEEQG